MRLSARLRWRRAGAALAQTSRGAQQKRLRERQKQHRASSVLGIYGRMAWVKRKKDNIACSANKRYAENMVL